MMKNNFCHITDADKNEIILLMQEQKIPCQENRVMSAAWWKMKGLNGETRL